MATQPEFREWGGKRCARTHPSFPLSRRERGSGGEDPKGEGAAQRIIQPRRREGSTWRTLSVNHGRVYARSSRIRQRSRRAERGRSSRERERRGRVTFGRL